MKSVFLLPAFFYSVCSIAQTDSLSSALYSWKELQVQKTGTGERRQILEGSSTHLDYLEIHATTVAPGKAPHAAHRHPEEELIIVKEGTLKIIINDSSKIIGPGSVAVIMPEDMHGLVNGGNTDVIYYVIRSRSKLVPDPDRGRKTGGSFVIDANDIAFQEGPKGGKKQYFERPTWMLKRLEMHVTTLNEGSVSHAPHMHLAEEIMIVISGDVEVQIGAAHHKASGGDLAIIRSGILHAPKNDGKGPCSYFAIQFH